MVSIGSRKLTVKVDSSLDNVVTQDVTVSEVLGDDSGLGSAIPGSLFSVNLQQACPLEIEAQ